MDHKTYLVGKLSHDLSWGAEGLEKKGVLTNWTASDMFAVGKQ